MEMEKKSVDYSGIWEKSNTLPFTEANKIGETFKKFFWNIFSISIHYI